MTSQHAAFHHLQVAAIDELTDDSVAITFEVPEELRADYAFAHGQHLSSAAATVRRSYSSAPPSPASCGSGSSSCPAGRSARTSSGASDR